MSVPQRGGRISSWSRALDSIIGGIAEKPRIIRGVAQPRQILHLTIAFDHDVMDVAPAARFVGQLGTLIECAAIIEALRPAYSRR
jgi:hypothetical protein